jgi:periplasmic divalent cation tolerance protein
MTTTFSCAETTVNTSSDAKRLAQLAVEQGLCACATISPVKSVYIWNGEIAEDEEIRIIFKLLTSNLSALEELIQAEHPYQLPQWISWEVSCSAAYGRWVSGTP